MAEQPHARFYRGLPPVVRHPRRRWLTVSAFSIVAVLAIAVPVAGVMYALRSAPSGYFGGAGRPGGHVALLDWYSVMWSGGALVVGGYFGFRHARGWLSTLAVYAIGFGLWLWLMPLSGLGGQDPWRQSAGDIFGWLFWIFGVSAGVGFRSLLQRRRLVRASFLSRPT